MTLLYTHVANHCQYRTVRTRSFPILCE